jgi:heptosyltransferase-2
MPPRNILAICPNWVGDLVMATPAFRALRSSFPGARITGVVRPYGSGILEGSPRFDRLVLFDRRRDSLSRSARAVAALRAEDFDLAVVFPNSLSAALFARLAGARERVGYARDRRSFLLTKALPRPGEGPGEEGAFRPVYMVDYYLALARAAGAGEGGRELELFGAPESAAKAARLLEALGAAPGDRLVGLNPGAAFGSSKCWPPERFAEAGDRLAERLGARCIVLAGPGERDVQDAIASRMRTRPHCPAPEDLPLPVLKEVVKRLALMVTNDTGPRHLAHAFGVPCVVLMGPTDPRYTEDPGERAAVLRVDVPCGPCHLKTCPSDHRCMTALTAAMAVEAAERLLGAGGGTERSRTNPSLP